MIRCGRERFENELARDSSSAAIDGHGSHAVGQRGQTPSISPAAMEDCRSCLTKFTSKPLTAVSST